MYFGQKEQLNITLFFRIFVSFVAMVFAMAPAPVGAQDHDVEFTKEIQMAKEKVFPALVHIKAVALDFRGGEEQKYTLEGSGTIISSDGLVLTNFHVAGDGVRFSCILSNKEEISADYVGGDYLTDLAFIKLNLDEKRSSDPLPYAHLGDSDKVRVGDFVMAMGAPLGIARTVTAGIVSNVERPIRTGSGTYPRGRTDVGQFTNWIQHDAIIYPGNSGGPLVNLDGEIIGINTLGGRTGIAYSVPSNVARDLLGTVFQHKGYPRSFYGMEFQYVLRGYTDRGVVISYVYPNTPAAEAGIEPGDILLEINGQELNARFEEDIPLIHRFIADLPIEKKAKFKVLKGDDEVVLEIKGELREDEVLRERECKSLGITVREISKPIMLRLRLKNKEGVLISGVKPGSPAATAKPPLTPNAIITHVNGRSIHSYDDFVDEYRNILKEKQKTVLIQFEMAFSSYVTLVKPRRKQKMEWNTSSGLFIKKGWLGCSLQLFEDDLGEQLYGAKEIAGYRITKVYENGPAYKAGLQEGDIIAYLDGKKLQAKRAQDISAFMQKIRSKNKGDKVTLTIYRDGEKIEKEVMIDLEPEGPGDVKPVENNDFGLTVRDIVLFDRVQMNLKDDEEGVIILKTERGGWADFSRGFPPGGIIMKIDGVDIKNSADFIKVMEEAEEQNKKFVIFYVLYGGQGRFVTVETGWEQLD